MSDQTTPATPHENALTKIGHGIVKAVTFLPDECVKLEHAISDIIKAEPQVKAQVQTIICDVEKASLSLEAAVASGNPAAIAAAVLADLPALEKLFADFKLALPIFEAAYKAVKADVNAMEHPVADVSESA